MNLSNPPKRLRPEARAPLCSINAETNQKMTSHVKITLLPKLFERSLCANRHKHHARQETIFYIRTQAAPSLLQNLQLNFLSLNSQTITR